MSAPAAGSRELLRRACRTLRERPGIILLIALLVLVLPQALEAVVGQYTNHLTDLGTEPTTLLGLIVAGTQIASTLGFVFYAGVLDRIVGEHQWGDGSSTFRQVVGDIPWIRLLVADIVFVVMASIAAVAFLIPGLIVYTYFSLVGPIIIIEQQGIYRSFLRTGQVVRHHFWLVARLVTVPVVVEGVLEDGLHNLLDHDRALGVILATILGVALAAVIGVLEVTVAHELVRRKPLPGLVYEGGAPIP